MLDVVRCKVMCNHALARHNQHSHAWGLLYEPSQQSCNQGTLTLASHRQFQEPFA